MLAETGSAWHREVQSFLDQFHDRVACALLDVRELEQGGSEEMLELMQPGSVLVDVALDQGGCFGTSMHTTHQGPDPSD